MIRRTALYLSLALSLGLGAAWPAPVEAQRRAIRRPIRSRVFVHASFYRPFFYPGYYYHPHFYGGYGWSPFYGPYAPYPVHGGYGGSAARIQVTPRETEVYVDGYFAGVVDDFDGFFQRLRLPPGEHEITLYLDGHRTLRQRLYLAPGATYNLRHTMGPLQPGEAPEPRPVGAPQTGAPAGPPPEYPPDRSESRSQRADQPEAAGFGVLSIRVQPVDAEVLIDGERWLGPEDGSRLTVHVPAGSHRLEVRREGFEPYRTDVTVDDGETIRFNVSLPSADPR